MERLQCLHMYVPHLHRLGLMSPGGVAHVEWHTSNLYIACTVKGAKKDTHYNYYNEHMYSTCTGTRGVS